MTDINWHKDLETALEKGKSERKPILLDFSAAPMWSGCARLDAEVYPDPRVSSFISEHFVPAKFHIKEKADIFKRMGAQWTPTILLLDPDGTERHRMEGFYPVEDLLAQLELGLGKISFQSGDYSKAEENFRTVYEKYPQSGAAPEATYWAGVSGYKGSNMPERLGETAKLLKEKYPDSEWNRKASVWSG